MEPGKIRATSGWEGETGQTTVAMGGSRNGGIPESRMRERSMRRAKPTCICSHPARPLPSRDLRAVNDRKLLFSADLQLGDAS